MVSYTTRLKDIDDSARDSSSNSSSEESLDFHSDASFDSSLRHSLSDHSSPDSASTSVRLSRKRHRSRGIDVRVVAETIARDKIGTDTRNIVEGGDDMVTHPVMLEDVQEAAQEERAAEGTYKTLRSLGCRIIGVESAVTALTKRIAELERDNRRLRGTA
nr:hypothetical protein [Tanacetum cinerariifolium]